MSPAKPANKHIPIPPTEFKRRCEKLFGPLWVHEVAFNLKRTRQYVEGVRDGILKSTEELRLILDGWESGGVPMKRRPTPDYGRPRKSKAPVKRGAA